MIAKFITLGPGKALDNANNSTKSLLDNHFFLSHKVLCATANTPPNPWSAIIVKATNKSLQEFHKLELHKKNKKYVFSKFCSYIKEKKIKKIIQKLLKSIDLNIQYQIIPTLYLISGYSKYLLNNTPLDVEIKELSDKIIIMLLQNNCDKIKIKTQIILFNNKFELWKKNDKKEQIMYFIKSYYFM